MTLYGLAVAVFLGLVFLTRWINILNEYERAVVFRLGRLLGRPKGPGLVLIFWPKGLFGAKDVTRRRV